MPGTIKIRLIRSIICTPEKHKVIIRALGLKKMNRVVERPDTPAFRGMVRKVPHLLELVEDDSRVQGTVRPARS
jgi:large subunit ribosomal protein L30